MNKKIWVTAILGIAALAFVGCGPIDNNGPGVPVNPTIAAGGDGKSVVISWTAPAEAVDGYYVFFTRTNSTDTTGNYVGSATSTSFTHSNPGMAGYYHVRSYTGSTVSDPSNVVDDMPTEGTGATIYEWDNTLPSGYGWNTSGVGATYPYAQKDAADIFLNGGDVSPGLNPMQLSSADVAPWGGSRVSGILDMGGSSNWDDETMAPEIGAGLYYNWENAVNGHIYFIATNDNYSVKIEITDLAGSGYPNRSITFKYAFQTLGPNFYLF